MTTLAGARAFLRGGVESNDIACTYVPGGTEPPYVVVVADGIDLGRRVGAEATFRLVCVAGAADADASALELDTLKQRMATMIRGLDGIRMVEVRRDVIRRLGDSDLLTADVIASCLIDI